MIVQGFKGGDVRKPVIENDGVSVNVGGSFTRSSSKTRIEILDLLGEGPMQGIVSGYYRMHGGYLGRTGWREAEFIPYNNGILSGTNTNSGILRSVFYNDVPILDSSDRYNFSQINFKFVNGGPMGATGVGTESILDDELTVTKQVNEAMLGPNYDFSDNGRPTDVLTAGNERFDQFRGDYDKLLGRDSEAALINRKVYRYYDRNITAFDVNVRINALNYQEIEDEDKYGDNLGYYLDYVIKARPIFKGQDKDDNFLFEKIKNVALKGKVTSSPFLQSDRIEVDDFTEQADFLAWELEIIRKTADAIHPAVTCNVFVDSITQIYGQSFRYPNSAMASNLFDAEFFSEVPDTSYEMEMLKIKVPDNFDPATRSYDGDWDGTFSTEKKWTSDPAWTFYDILTNKRYGVGDCIDEDLVDKWSLYEISQYCNELVRDGYDPTESPTSGLEPRFEANAYINQQKDAYQVINDMASIFRGMTYYMGGSIDVSQDSPKEPRFIFTNANVVDGNFTYSSSSQRSRHTIALVRYNDKLNHYAPTVEYVEDSDGIRKYGLIQRDLTAVGCSSRGQAFRLGKWVLTTERTETDTVNFQAGMEGNALRPGDVIKVFDENKTKKRYSGRTLRTEVYAYPNESGAVILLDRKVPLHNYSTYKFSLATPTYSYESTLVDKSTDFTSADISGLKRGTIQEIYFTGGPSTIIDEGGKTKMVFTGDSYTGIGMNQFDTGSYDVYNNLIFAIEQSGNIADNCESQLFKVIRSEEVSPSLYNIFGMEHNSGKYNIIETGLAFESSITQKTIGSPQIGPIYESDDNCTLYFQVHKGDNSKYIIMYARSDGESFSTSTLPDSSFKVSVNPVSNDQNKILIQYSLVGSNVQYDFAFWGTDGANYSSNGAVYSQDKNNGQLYGVDQCAGSVCNFKVYSLRGKCLAGDGTAASAATYDYQGANPTFKWNVDFDSNYEIDDDIYVNYQTRVSYYQPDLVTISDGKFYDNGAELYRQAFYGFSLDGELTFSLSDNIFGHNNRNTFPKIGPFRNYDVVVDIVDAAGKSSRDCNPNDEGYDVLQVRNPAPDAVDIDAYVVNYYSSVTGWQVGSGGRLTLDLSSLVFGDGSDIKGYVVYYHFEDFTWSDINDPSKNIGYYSYYFTSEGDKNIAQTVPFKNVKAIAYVGIVILDSFDEKAADEIRRRSNENTITPDVFYRETVPTSDRLTIVKKIEVSN